MDDRAILARITELGLELPTPPKPVASYIPVRVSHGLAFVAGQVPMIDGAVMHAGLLGDPDGGVTTEQGAEAARRAALQALSALRDALGSFEPLAGIAQVTVYVASAPDFTEHPAVANGASDLLVDVLGDAGAPRPRGGGHGLAAARRVGRGRGHRRARLTALGATSRGNRRSPSRRVTPVRSKCSSSGNRELAARAERLAERAHGDAVRRRPRDGLGPRDERGREDEVLRDAHRQAAGDRCLDHVAADAGARQLGDRRRGRLVLAADRVEQPPNAWVVGVERDPVARQAHRGGGALDGCRPPPRRRAPRRPGPVRSARRRHAARAATTERTSPIGAPVARGSRSWNAVSRSAIARSPRRPHVGVDRPASDHGRGGRRRADEQRRPRPPAPRPRSRTSSSGRSSPWSPTGGPRGAPGLARPSPGATSSTRPAGDGLAPPGLPHHEPVADREHERVGRANPRERPAAGFQRGRAEEPHERVGLRRRPRRP